LWPDHRAVFGVVAWGEDGIATGIALHAECAPPVGSVAPAVVRAQVPTATTIVRYETAGDRYAAWFASEREGFLRLLAQELGVDPSGLIENWKRDREQLVAAVRV